MKYKPTDILDYIIEKEYESDFMVAIANHKYDYSIGEITDVRFRWKDDVLYVKSVSYGLKQPIEDADILIASKAGKYISAFLSRYGNSYQLHFLVHECMVEDKANHEEEILQRVIQYMILKAVVQLRLDEPAKVDTYLGK